jgi:hypothetical protein
MKELLAVLVEKLKQMEAEAAVIAYIIMGFFVVGMSTIVLVKIINMLIKIVELFSTGHAH